MKLQSVFKSFLFTSCAALVLSSCTLLRGNNGGGTIDDLPLPQPPLSPPTSVVQQPALQPLPPQAPQSIGGLTGNRAAVLNNLLRQGAIGPYSIGLPYTFENQRYVPRENLGYREAGLASWYGPGLAGKPTSNGEKFNPRAHTAAHKTLPFSSILKVTNPANGKATLVRINDRGPFLPDHVIDLSQRAAQDLGLFTSQGSQVLLELLEQETRAVAQATGGTIGLNQPQVPSNATSNALAGTSTFVPQPTANLAPSQPLPPLPQAGVIQTAQAAPLTSSIITTTPLPPLPAAQTASQPIVRPTPLPQQAVIAPAIPQPVVQQPLPQLQPLPPTVQPAQPAVRPTQQTASAPAASAAGFYVQAGSYSSRENAEQVRNKLTSVGTVVIFPVMVSGKQMYRVRVGPYTTRQQAQSKLGTVIISGGPDAIVIQEG